MGIIVFLLGLIASVLLLGRNLTLTILGIAGVLWLLFWGGIIAIAFWSSIFPWLIGIASIVGIAVVWEWVEEKDQKGKKRKISDEDLPPT